MKPSFALPRLRTATRFRFPDLAAWTRKTPKGSRLGAMLLAMIAVMCLSASLAMPSLRPADAGGAMREAHETPADERVALMGELRHVATDLPPGSPGGPRLAAILARLEQDTTPAAVLARLTERLNPTGRGAGEGFSSALMAFAASCGIAAALLALAGRTGPALSPGSPPGEGPPGWAEAWGRRLEASLSDILGAATVTRPEASAAQAGSVRSAMLAGAQLATVALDAETRLLSATRQAEAALLTRAVGERDSAEIAGLRLAGAAGRLEAALGEMETIANQVTSVAQSLAVPAADPHLPVVLQRLDALAETLGDPARDRSLADSISQLEAIASNLPDIGRAEAVAARLEAVAAQADPAREAVLTASIRQFEPVVAALTGPAVVPTLTHASTTLGAATSELSDIVQAMRQLLVEAAALPARTDEVLNQGACHLSATAERVHTAIDTIAAQAIQSVETAGTRVAAQGQTAEAGIARAAEMLSTWLGTDCTGYLERIGSLSEDRMAAAVQQVEQAVSRLAAIEPQRSTPPSSSSVAARMLGAIAPDAPGTASLRAVLHGLGGVEADIDRLAHEAERLAVAADTALPAALVDGAPHLLASVHETAERLQSIATVLALACDGHVVAR